MAIKYHPKIGSILICNFDQGFQQPEMVKRRPVVIVSPPIQTRPGLCTVVALSTTQPQSICPYHDKLTIDPPLPSPWQSTEVWIKGDMIAAVGFHRLDLIQIGRDPDTKQRRYYFRTLSPEQIQLVQKCMLNALGLIGLTKHL